MSATNHTQNLGLSQFLGDDKPTWLGDYNSDMEKIDTAVHILQIGTTSTIAGQIHVLEDSVKDLIKIDATQEVKIQAITSSISMLQMDVVKNIQDIDNLDTREQRHYDALSASIDSGDSELEEVKLDVSYVKKNMEKVENLQIISTASVAKLQVCIHDAEIDIGNLQTQQGSNTTDIENLKAETDTLEAQQRIMDADIKQAKRDILANTTSIAAVAVKLEQTASDSNTRLDRLETDSASMRQDIDDNETVVAGVIQNVTALQTKTENITDGVKVPFGFGTTADNKRGYEKPDGTIEPFATATDIAEVQEDVDANMGDIATLQAKTANITEGKALPYSLGIADGGGYGYIKNGETGVTPFVSQSEIEQIVTIGEKTANIMGSPTISANVQSYGTGLYSLSNYDNSDLMSITSKPMHNMINIEEIDETVEKVNNIQKGATLKSTGAGITILSAPSGATFAVQNTSGNNNSIVITVNDAASSKFSVKFGSNKELNFPFGLGIDANGNYGYVKAGADTVTPFKELTNTTGGNYSTASTTNVAVYDIRKGIYEVRPLKTVDSNTLVLRTWSRGSINDINVVNNRVTIPDVSSIVALTGNVSGSPYIIHGFLIRDDNVVYPV